MEKIIIKNGNEIMAMEGDFAIVAVFYADGDESYGANMHLAGMINIHDTPDLIASAAVSWMKKITEDDGLMQLELLAKLKRKINEEVDTEIAAKMKGQQDDGKKKI